MCANEDRTARTPKLGAYSKASRNFDRDFFDQSLPWLRAFTHVPNVIFVYISVHTVGEAWIVRLDAAVRNFHHISHYVPLLRPGVYYIVKKICYKVLMLFNQNLLWEILKQTLIQQQKFQLQFSRHVQC